jgi:hypothetical protein
MISELICDADGCGHVEPVEEVTEAHIGMPCPRCGASMLSKDEYEGTRALAVVISALREADPDSPMAMVSGVRVRGDVAIITLGAPSKPMEARDG